MADAVRVIGLGNRDRGDDGIGCEVAARLKDKQLRGVRVLEHSGEVSGLLAHMEGAETVYLVDAAVSGAEPGAIRRLNASETALPPLKGGTSTHAMGLANAVELARALGQLPPCCIVYAVEGRCFDKGAPLSEPVASAVDGVIARILDDLKVATMHEASLLNALMRKIDDIADAEGAKRVTGVSVWLGALSHMTPGHFKEHFDQAAAGTRTEGAELDIEPSDDTGHPSAQDILLKSIDVEIPAQG